MSNSAYLFRRAAEKFRADVSDLRAKAEDRKWQYLGEGAEGILEGLEVAAIMLDGMAAAERRKRRERDQQRANG